MDSWGVIGFPRVREMLVGYCRTPMGVDRACHLKPFVDRAEADDELDRLTEIVALESEPAELAAAIDVRPLVERCRSGGVLTGEELLAVRRAAAALVVCRRFLDAHLEVMPLTGRELMLLDGDDRLAAEIARALDETGAVVDSASAELAGVRRELRGLRSRLVRRLEELIADHPDRFGERPTIRHERFVVPVRIEHRDKLAGVVHESSGTGQTLFVEPMATVEDQNRLEELRGREAEEVASVLRALSDRVAGSADLLGRGLEAVGRFDFLLAKMRFADEFACVRPELTARRIRIAGGRHPLLERRKVRVVPLDLELSEESNVLLISGPNAGGKTVVLKTLGLFCVLAASGMFVPAERGTQLPFYRRVFADIGDDQSLDSDLSSFTAHVGKLKTLLDEADAESLVLLDEVGASTSPEEGAALAIAVLEALHERGVRVVATSHFWTLKLYVQDHEKMMNAAMGIADNVPTYRLALGLPGGSSALEVAAGAGLPVELLDRARKHVGQGWVDLAGRLRRLERDLDLARTARAEADHQLAIARRMKADFETRLAAFQVETSRQREHQLARLRRLFDDARRQIENVVREIRESQASRDAIVIAKRMVEEHRRQLETEVAGREDDVGSRDARVGTAGSGMPVAGELVESRTLRQRGRVDTVDGAEVMVAFGSVRMRLPAGDLDRVAAESVEPATIPAFEPVVPAAQLNVIGRTREEALEQVVSYLEEASAAGLSEVRVLHGKGEGVLRRAVWGILRRDARVSRFRFAELNQGGRGVTVVEFKTRQA
jgi:DNA mismatch repair protein MutS2